VREASPDSLLFHTGHQKFIPECGQIVFTRLKIFFMYADIETLVLT
jgi:hypothetical protein